MLEEKIEHAQNVLKVALKLSSTYYHKPIVICYSGGKDSDILLDIAIKTLNKEDFIVLNSHTTLDAPETVYYIRNKFKKLTELGYTCVVKYPYYKGKRTSFWDLCYQKRELPTRLFRFCCRYLKEVATPKQIACTGVREDESQNREGRNEFGIRNNRKIYKSAQHVNVMIDFDTDTKNNSSFECEIIKGAKKNKDMIVNPIYNFTAEDVKQYVNTILLNINPLYSKGYTRVGCIGCPMANKQRYKQFKDYPQIKLNIQRLCNKIIGDGHSKYKTMDFKSGEDLFRWWMGEDYKQLRLDDLLKGGEVTCIE